MSPHPETQGRLNRLKIEDLYAEAGRRRLIATARQASKEPADDIADAAPALTSRAGALGLGHLRALAGRWRASTVRWGHSVARYARSLLFLACLLALDPALAAPSEASAESGACQGVPIGPGANLAYCDLTEADLIGADLTGADLSYANLAGVDTVGVWPDHSRRAGAACRTDAGLHGGPIDCALEPASAVVCAEGGSASRKQLLPRPNPIVNPLACAQVVGIGLREATLTGAVLIDADLRFADLRGADLTGADLTGTKLAGVRWGGTTCPDGTGSDATDGDGATCLGNLRLTSPAS
jgi:hypothetical protein